MWSSGSGHWAMIIGSSQILKIEILLCFFPKLTSQWFTIRGYPANRALLINFCLVYSVLIFFCLWYILNTEKGISFWWDFSHWLLEVVLLTIFDRVSDGNFIKMKHFYFSVCITLITSYCMFHISLNKFCIWRVNSLGLLPIHQSWWASWELEHRQSIEMCWEASSGAYRYYSCRGYGLISTGVSPWSLMGSWIFMPESGRLTDNECGGSF